MIDKYVSGKIVLDTSNNKFVFPALNVSNNFATIDYDAHINTKIEYTINHVFRSMPVQELKTLHTICELERNVNSLQSSQCQYKTLNLLVSF